MMGDWWMTAFCGMSVLAVVGLVAGLLLGYRWGSADREEPAPGYKGHFPAQEAEGFWASVKLDVQQDTPAMVPLSSLVLASPASERATGWIARITADTDRWIAGIEAGE